MQIRHASSDDAPVIADFNIQIALETEQRQLDSERVRQGVLALLKDPVTPVIAKA